MAPTESTSPPKQVRLDVWLDVACVFRTRSEAQRACKGGKVSVNGQRAKPNRDIWCGDQIAVTRTNGRRQEIIVKRLSERHLAKTKARILYQDVTPPPSKEELEFRTLLRRTAAATQISWRMLNKRNRRILRRLKGQ